MIQNGYPWHQAVVPPGSGPPPASPTTAAAVPSPPPEASAVRRDTSVGASQSDSAFHGAGRAAESVRQVGEGPARSDTADSARPGTRGCCGGAERTMAQPSLSVGLDSAQLGTRVSGGGVGAGGHSGGAESASGVAVGAESAGSGNQGEGADGERGDSWPSGVLEIEHDGLGVESKDQVGVLHSSASVWGAGRWCMQAASDKSPGQLPDLAARGWRGIYIPPIQLYKKLPQTPGVCVTMAENIRQPLKASLRINPRACACFLLQLPYRDVFFYREACTASIKRATYYPLGSSRPFLRSASHTL